MKIANIVRRFSFEEWGGTETVVWNTSKCLVQRGWEADILCTNALSIVPEELFSGVNIRRFNYFYPYFPLFAANRVRLDKKGGNPYSFGLFNFMKQQDYDLLHCHTMARMGEMVKKIAGIKHIPYVVSFHGGCYDVPKEEIAEMIKPVRHSFNYGKIIDAGLGFNGDFIDKANGIICVGLNEYELAKQRYPDKIIEYIPNGVELEKFSVRPDFDFRLKYNIHKDSRVILCVSRIDYQKNQKRLIDFAAKMISADEDLHFVIIGPVTADLYYNELKEQIRDSYIQNRVTVIEGLSPDSRDLVAAYHCADMFILPSLHEPFGIVVLEAWASGVPVIASRVGGLKNLITENHDGIFFDPESTDSLIEAYHRLVKDPGFKQRLANNAYSTVTNNYTWEKITDKLTEFYQKVVDEYGKEKK